VPAPVSRNGTAAAGAIPLLMKAGFWSHDTPKRTHGRGQVIAGHWVGAGGWQGVGTLTPMTAACIGPEAAVDVLKDALSYW